jgi:hypothetical protein
MALGCLLPRPFLAHDAAELLLQSVHLPFSLFRFGSLFIVAPLANGTFLGRKKKENSQTDLTRERKPKQIGPPPKNPMFVLFQALLWSLPFVGFPYALVALFLGRAGDVAALVAFYLALGALASRLTQPRPLGDEPSEAPHLTLCHPHGIIATGFLVLASGDRVWNARRRAFLGAPHFLAAVIFPFGDIWSRCMSCRCSSPSRASMVSLMRQRKDIYLFPGGFVEAARHSYHKDVVDVGSRGAVRLALTHGYAVRACFAFGERETAYNLHGLWGIRVWLARRGIPAVVPLMRLWARAPRVAFSPTIQFPTIMEPTDADVERWHAAYVAALRKLHARYKRLGDELVVHDRARGS